MPKTFPDFFPLYYFNGTVEETNKICFRRDFGWHTKLFVLSCLNRMALVRLENLTMISHRNGRLVCCTKGNLISHSNIYSLYNKIRKPTLSRDCRK